MYGPNIFKQPFFGQNLQATEQQEEKDNEKLITSSVSLKHGWLLNPALYSMLFCTSQCVYLLVIKMNNTISCFFDLICVTSIAIVFQISKLKRKVKTVT